MESKNEKTGLNNYVDTFESSHEVDATEPVHNNMDATRVSDRNIGVTTGLLPSKKDISTLFDNSYLDTAGVFDNSVDTADIIQNNTQKSEVFGNDTAEDAVSELPIGVDDIILEIKTSVGKLKENI